jgi:hypothetical protein
MTTFLEPSPTRFAWPADTNLLFSRGTCKLSLNIQQPRIRDIIRDACDNVQAQLLCRHAFPDAGLELSFVKDSIFAAAHAHGPAAASICERLVHDEFYMSEIMSLVSRTTLIITTLKPFIATCEDSFFPKQGQRAL